MNFTRNTILFLFLIMLAITQYTSQSTTTGDVITITKTSNVTKPGCQSQCGNVTIPYLFGIGPGCFLSEWFEITCNTSVNPPRTQSGGLIILEFTDYTFQVANKVASRCYDPFGNITKDNPAGTRLNRASPFSFSQKKNQFTLIGCDDFALYVGLPNFTSGGCIALCSKPEKVVNRSCSGVGCCQTSILKALKFYYTSVASMTGTNHTTICSFDPCTYSFFGELERFTFNGVSDFMDPNFRNRTMASVPC